MVVENHVSRAAVSVPVLREETENGLHRVLFFLFSWNA